MEYIIRNTDLGEHDFAKAIAGNTVSVLTLDQKWHHLFAAEGKPKKIQEQEKRVTGWLQAQARAQQELKELKKLKATLMNNIVQNMDGAEGKNQRQERKLSEDRRLIDETKQKMQECEDTLLEIPRHLKEDNDLLLQLTVEYCYYQLRTNAAAIGEIGDWITRMRMELKRQIIRKQRAEVSNREIYAYMHDVFGAGMLNILDLQYQEETEEPAGQEPKGPGPEESQT